MKKRRMFGPQRLQKLINQYFAKREDGSATVADLCAELGCSIGEWKEMGRDDALKGIVDRTMTKIIAEVERYTQRPATITKLLLEEYRSYWNTTQKVEFTLFEQGAVQAE